MLFPVAHRRVRLLVGLALVDVTMLPVRAYSGIRFNLDCREPPPRPPGYPHPKVSRSVQDSNVPSIQTRLLPPTQVVCRAKIVEDTASVTVIQHFNNVTDYVIQEAAYQFPLYHEAAIVDFTCSIGADKIFRGEIKPKGEAREEFKRTIFQGRTGALLEQDTAEIFTTFLGSIPARTNVKVEISMVLLLKYNFKEGESSTTTFTLPTSIAPRFGEAPCIIRGPGAGTGEKALSIEVDILSTHPIQSVEARGHECRVSLGAHAAPCLSWKELSNAKKAEQAKDNHTSAFVTLKNGTDFLDRDFVLEILKRTITPSTTDFPSAIIETHPTKPGSRAAMLTIPSKHLLQFAEPDARGEIIFLADRSGSMADKMDGLKSSMEFFLHGLMPGKVFNIWSFGSSHSCLFPRSMPYNNESLQAALSHIKEDFISDMGGTSLLPGLKAVVDMRDPSRTTDIIVLTDGEVWDSVETIEFVARTKLLTDGRVRFFALGIGHEVSHDLVEGIATTGGGYADVITNAAGGGWEPKMVSMLSAALTGHVGPLHVELEGCHLDTRSHCSISLKHKVPHRPAIQMSPIDLRSLTVYDRNRVYFLFQDGEFPELADSITVKTGAPGGKPISAVIPIHQSSKPDTLIHSLAARVLLRDLERCQSWIQNDRVAPQHSAEEFGLTKKVGEALACEWSLASNWTSFIALENPVLVSSADVNQVLETPVVSSEPNQTLEMHSIEVMADEDILLLPRGNTLLEVEKKLRFSGRVLSRGKIKPTPPTDDDTSMLEMGSVQTYGPCSMSTTRDMPTSIALSIDSGLSSKFSATRSPFEVVQYILRLQIASGKFNVSPVEITTKLTEQLRGFYKLESLVAEHPDDVAVVIAAMVVVYLETSYPDEKSLWELIVMKAKAFISLNDGDEILKKARSLAAAVNGDVDSTSS